MKQILIQNTIRFATKHSLAYLLVWTSGSHSPRSHPPLCNPRFFQFLPHLVLSFTNIFTIIQLYIYTCRTLRDSVLASGQIWREELSNFYLALPKPKLPTKKREIKDVPTYIYKFTEITFFTRVTICCADEAFEDNGTVIPKHRDTTCWYWMQVW